MSKRKIIKNPNLRVVDEKREKKAEVLRGMMYEDEDENEHTINDVSP